MKKAIKLLALILAGLMLCSSFVACGGDDDTAETTAPSNEDTSPETGVSDPVQLAIDTLKQTVNWGGKDLSILYCVDIAGYSEEVENVQENGSVINEAVYQRNSLFEEYAKLKFKTVQAGQSDIITKLQAEVQAPNGDFQYISNQIAKAANNATRGFLYDYMDLNIDYEQVCWDEGTLDFALDGHVFFMNGAFNIVDDDVTMLMIFNKRLRGLYYSSEDLYKIAKDQKWTLDKFGTLASGLSSDNGDGVWDSNDTYGFSCPSSIGDTFFYGAGLQYIANSRDMVSPELVLTGSKLEQAIDVMNKAREILHNNHTSYGAKAGDEGGALTVFLNGRSLFYVEAASYLRTLQGSMADEYGILPIPKYSESQESYYTWSHDIGSTLSFPTTVGKAGSDMDNFAGVLELYALLSEQLVRPAYYKQMLTTRNVHDVQSAEMVDLIFLHRTYDMAQIYTATFNLNGIFTTSVIEPGAPTFASQFSSRARGFNTGVRKLMKNLRS